MSKYNYRQTKSLRSRSLSKLNNLDHFLDRSGMQFGLESRSAWNALDLDIKLTSYM